LVEFDTGDPTGVAAWWQAMMEDGLIRPIPDRQKFLPNFPDDTDSCDTDETGDDHAT